MNIKSLSISTSLTLILIVIMTIWSELSKNFKNFLAGLTGHHWTAKGLISLVFFILVYFIFMNLISDKEEDRRLIKNVIWIAIFSSIIIFLFYVYEFYA